MRPLWTVVESESCRKTVDEYGANIAFSEAWEALKWSLAREPEIGEQQKISGELTPYYVYVQGPHPIAKTPKLLILYEIESYEVVVLQLDVLS